MSRKVRLRTDVIHRTRSHSLKRNTMIEEQYNRNYREVKRKYGPGQLVKGYHNGKKN